MLQKVQYLKQCQKLLSSLLPGLYFFVETKHAICVLLRLKSARNPGHYRLFVSTGTRPGQMQKFRDCPGHSGTLGNYGICQHGSKPLNRPLRRWQLSNQAVLRHTVHPRRRFAVSIMRTAAFSQNAGTGMPARSVTRVNQQFHALRAQARLPCFVI